MWTMPKQRDTPDLTRYFWSTEYGAQAVIDSQKYALMRDYIILSAPG